MPLQDVLRQVWTEIPSTPRELDAVSELDARREYVDPILAELGWRGRDRLRREHPVASQKRLKMDYVLFGEDRKPVAFIEAKRPRERLAKHVDQVLDYAFREGVDICALTNGKLWWLYLPRERGRFDDRRFAVLDVAQWWNDDVSVALMGTLGFDALTTGTAEGNAKKLLKQLRDEKRRKAEIPNAWRRLLSEPNPRILDLIAEEVFQGIGQRPSRYEIHEVMPQVIGDSQLPSLFDPPTTIAMIARAVNEVCNTSLPNSIRSSLVDRATDLLIYLARKHTKCSFVEIANWVDLHDDATVTDIYHRIDEQIRLSQGDDAEAHQIRQWYEAVCRRLELQV